jgi:hypothetical protein
MMTSPCFPCLRSDPTRRHDQQVDALDQVRDLRVEPTADLLPRLDAGLQLAGDLRQQLC